jgi:hypothetical protein
MSIAAPSAVVGRPGALIWGPGRNLASCGLESGSGSGPWFGLSEFGGETI